MRAGHVRITRLFCKGLGFLLTCVVVDMTELSKESWYHGRISRVDAEKILDNAGGTEGTFLVRDSLTITGEYVLSLCHQV